MERGIELAVRQALERKERFESLCSRLWGANMAKSGKNRYPRTRESKRCLKCRTKFNLTIHCSSYYCKVCRNAMQRTAHTLGTLALR